MDNENSIPFAPFVAINEFMRAEFRLQIIEELFAQAKSLPEDHKLKIDHLTRKYVKVQGFRNPTKAPVRLRAKASQEAFEKYSEFAAAILFAWLDMKMEIASQVTGLLDELGWDRILPLGTDRSQLPGFYIQWPGGFDFDKIYQLYQARNPDSAVGNDEISLLTVLVSMRLPFEEEEQME